ncbi:MAG: hypothetical protein J5959_02375 [Butyrivibrio sp.]|nr:hypothetical protein [Butyrivibrio sp.]MBP3242144.1 hypothetical protein [Oribacterium sp.]
MMEAKEVFEAVCGRDEVGDNRALVRVQVGIVDRTTMEETVEGYHDMDNPVVEICQRAGTTRVDLGFEDFEDPDFCRVSDLIKEFQDLEGAVDEARIPVISLTILPKEMEGFYVHGVTGVNILRNVEEREGLCVAFVFANDFIHAYELDREQVYGDEGEEMKNDNPVFGRL